MDKDPVGVQPVPEERLYIGGHWIEGQEWYEVTDKFDHKVLALIPQCNADLYDMALLAARDSAAALARLPGAQRASLLRSWADQLAERAEPIGDTLRREAALPVNWAEAEVRQAVETLRQAAGEAERGGGMHTGNGHTPDVDISFTDPLGTVGILLPDRHGLYFAAQLAGAALATSCPVVIRPGIFAPLAVKQFVELSSKLGWPPGSINLLFGSHREIGRKLAADPRAALLVLAGGMHDREALGAVRAGRPLVSVGTGYGAAILDHGVDIAQVVPQLLALRFKDPVIGAARPCFVLVPQELSVPFRETLAAALSGLETSSIHDPACEVPWQISDAMAQRAENWLGSIVQTGGIVFHGGQRRTSYIEPAIVIPPAGFRPIPPPPPEAPFFIIEAFEQHPDRHLERISDLQHAYVFTSELDAALELARQPRVPRVDIFTAQSTPNPQPGRIRDTEGLRRALNEMSRPKWVEVHLADEA